MPRLITRCFGCAIVHRLDDGRAERLGYVTDAQTDYTLLWMCNLVGVHLLCDVGKQVVVGLLMEMFINLCHILFLLLFVVIIDHLLFKFALIYNSISPSKAKAAGPVM